MVSFFQENIFSRKLVRVDKILFILTFSSIYIYIWENSTTVYLTFDPTIVSDKQTNKWIE